MRVSRAMPAASGGHAEDVGHVAGVRCIAAEGDAAAALDDVGMTAGAGDALTEPQVRPWAVGDGGARRQHQLDLGVVEPHAVGEQQMRPEHAEVIEVHDRTPARAGQVALGIRRRRRQVHRHVDARRLGQIGGAGQQFVRRQVVADQRDPALDQPAGWVRWRRPLAAGRAPRRPCRRTGRPRCPSPTCRWCRGCRRPASPRRRCRGGRPCRLRPRWSRRSARDSTAHSIADISSSAGVCAPCSGTDHAKIDSPGDSRSGMQLRNSGPPVWCWWALIMPGVTTHPDASTTVAPGCAASSATVDPTATMVEPSTTTEPPISTSRDGFIVTTSPLAMISSIERPFPNTVASWPTASTR